MTIRIETVLCPVDFSDICQRELQVAVEVVRVFGARLVLHHDVASTSPGLARGWEWNGLHRATAPSESEAEKHLQSMMAKLPAGIRAEACVTSGPPVPALLGLAEALRGDLIVMGSHGWSTPDHASISERIIDGSPCAVLTVPDGSYPFRLQPQREGEYTEVLVPTDLTASAVTRFAFDLARRVPLWLHLLHVTQGSAKSADEAKQHLEHLRPADLVGRTDCHVLGGDPTKGIIHFARRTAPDFVVMGEHAPGVLRHLFTHDTARDVLHQASRPVWFVPA